MSVTVPAGSDPGRWPPAHGAYGDKGTIMGIEFTKLAEGVEVLHEWQLTPQEREDHDYLNWAAMERGEDSASFVRYEGTTYPLNDFSADWGITRGAGLPEEFRGWHGYLADSFSSGVVIRYQGEDCEEVDLATFYVKD